MLKIPIFIQHQYLKWHAQKHNMTETYQINNLVDFYLFIKKSQTTIDLARAQFFHAN